MDFFATVATVLTVGFFSNLATDVPTADAGSFLALGISIACLLVIFNIAFGAYETRRIVFNVGDSLGRLFLVWNSSFLFLVFVLFLVRSSHGPAPIAFGLIYVFGFATLCVARGVMIFRGRQGIQRHGASVSRAVLVGAEGSLANFEARYRPLETGVDIVCSFVMRGRETMAEDLSLAMACLQVLLPDDIFILTPLEDDAELEAMLAAFRGIPASVHIGLDPMFGRFPQAEIVRVGAIASLKIVREPLSLMDACIKRTFDVLLAAVLLSLSSPLLLMIAIAIAFDSPGPVLTRRTCRGLDGDRFALEAFRVHATDGGPSTKDGLTRVGSILRRFNLDRLPELLNVLRGDMTLIGPMPQPARRHRHEGDAALVHSRVHNLKPGVIGWAQLHGLHEPSLSRDVRDARVRHDLFYIDNRSYLFDLVIVLRTILRSVPLFYVPELRPGSVKAIDLCAGSTARGSKPDRDARYEILGVAIDNIDRAAALALMIECLRSPDSRTSIFIVNAHALNIAGAYPNFREVLNGADYRFGDGVGVALAARLHNRTPRGNLNGTDLIPGLFEAAGGLGLRCFLLGGQAPIVAAAARVVALTYPGWSICGHHHGFLDDASSAAIVEAINASGADLLLVGMGNPNQECWITENRERLSCRLIVGVGALFSYLSGDTPRAPALVRRAGLEWLFVLASQQHKWRRYVFGIPAYVLRVTCEVALHAARDYEQATRERRRRRDDETRLARKSMGRP